jgi:hypothetical protein
LKYTLVARAAHGKIDPTYHPFERRFSVSVAALASWVLGSRVASRGLLRLPGGRPRRRTTTTGGVGVGDCAAYALGAGLSSDGEAGALGAGLATVAVVAVVALGVRVLVRTTPGATPKTAATSSSEGSFDCAMVMDL